MVLSAATEKCIGLSLAIAGNLLISISLNVQKYVHRLYGDEHYTTIPLWWMAIALMIFGELGNFSAYAFAPAVLVAPLGAVSVLMNGAIAFWYGKEPCNLRDVIGYLLAVVGGVLFIYFAPIQTAHLTAALFKEHLTEPAFVSYFITLCIATAFLLYISEYNDLGQFLVVDMLICAFSGSMTVMAAKGLAMFLREALQGDRSMFHDWVIYALFGVLGVTVVIQLAYLNKAMQRYGTMQIVPVNFVLFTFFAILGGGVLFREFQTLHPTVILMFLAGMLLTFLGVYVIMSRRSASEDALTKEDEAATLLPSPPAPPSTSAPSQECEAVLVNGILAVVAGLIATAGLLSLPVLPLYVYLAVAVAFGVGSVALIRSNVKLPPPEVELRTNPLRGAADEPQSAYDFVVKDAKGQPYPMSQFKGKVALIMNTASECSYTDNGYKAATELYDKYKYKGLVVLGFPCNQFGGQEPGSAESVAEFACTRYKATFPVMGKVDVNGPNADPLWVHMKAHRPGILGTKSIKWNFTVFLVDKTGETVARHSPGTKASALESEIVELLACNVRNDTWHSASASTQLA